MKRIVFLFFVAAMLVLILTSCDRVKIEIKEPEEPTTEVSNPVAEPENGLSDYTNSICPTAFGL